MHVAPGGCNLQPRLTPILRVRGAVRDPFAMGLPEDKPILRVQ